MQQQGIRRQRLSCPVVVCDVPARRAQGLSVVDGVYPPRLERARRVAARVVGAGDTITCTWGELEEAIAQAAAGLIAVGVQPGDRVGLIAGIDVRWTVIDMAILLCGAVSVPMHPDCAVREYENICIHAGIQVIAVGGVCEIQRLRAMRNDVFRSLRVIQMRGALTHNTRVMGWDDFLDGGAGYESDVHERWRNLKSDQWATIVYTSGAEGEPKGAVFDHRAVLSVPRALARAGLVKSDDTQLLCTPLSHGFGRTLQWAWLLAGHEAVFCTPEAAIDLMPHIKPTVMAAGPRLYERLLARVVYDAMPAFPGGHHVASMGLDALTDAGHTPWTLRGITVLVSPWLRLRLRRQTGGRLSRMISGMAALSPGTWHGYRALGVELLPCYGLTEAGSFVSVSHEGAARPGYVGRALRGTHVRLGAQGHIWVRGPAVMRGYWPLLANAANASNDAWLDTGDIGEIDPDGFLRIVGRARDMMVLESGRHVFPDVLESRLMATPWILHAMVHASGRPYVSALLTITDDMIHRLMREEKIQRRSYAEIVTHPALLVRVSEVIGEVNNTLPEADRIQRFYLVPQRFTASGGELTPTGKLRRSYVESRYKAVLERMY